MALYELCSTNDGVRKESAFRTSVLSMPSWRAFGEVGSLVEDLSAPSEDLTSELLNEC